MSFDYDRHTEPISEMVISTENNRITSFEFKFEGKDYGLRFNALCENGFSYFKFLDNYDVVVGKSISNIVARGNHFRIIFTDFGVFEMKLVTISNGYYSGWLYLKEIKYISISDDDNTNNDSDDGDDGDDSSCISLGKISPKLVVVIGLPGSGKTTYINEVSGTKFDDFINTFCTGEFMRELERLRYADTEQPIYIGDPRLCDYGVFKKFMRRILEVIEAGELKLILFENDPKACINNAKQRASTAMDDDDHDPDRVVNDIIALSKIYHVDNYTGYVHEIKKVS